MKVKYILFFLLIVSFEGYGQARNEIGLVYKGILPINNEYSQIVKYNNLAGLRYGFKISNNQTIGTSIYYVRSELFRHSLGIEPYYKYTFFEESKKANLFLKANLGYYTAIGKNGLIFTSAKINGVPVDPNNIPELPVGSSLVVIENFFSTKNNVFYANPEVGLEIKLGKRLVIEPSVGYAVVVRNLGNKSLDAFLQGKNFLPQFDLQGNPLPAAKDIKSNYFDPLNLSFGLVLGIKF